MIMCIDAPGSTTNSRSSGMRVDAGRHLFSAGEKKIALSCSFDFNTLLASFHAYSNRGGNCNCLLSHTARWFPIANNLQQFFVRAVLFTDSWPRRSSQNFHFCSQNSYFESLARYFSSPQFSISENQILTSSDASSGHTIPIRSWVYQTLVFLICTLLPRFHQAGLSSWTIKFHPT